MFALFVFKLIAGLIAVLVVGLLSLYVWVGREFHQVSVFLMTIEDFFVVAVGLVGFCIRLWDENFLLL